MKKKTLKTVSVLLALCFVLSAFVLCASAAMRGDVDASGKVTAADARLALRAAVNLEPIAKGTEAFTAADVTGDGQLTAADARVILRIAVGLERSEVTPVPSGKTEYDILRSGTFYFTGYTLDGGVVTPMSMGLSKDVLYMEMTMDGMHMGLLVKNNEMTFLNPEKKTYWKPNAFEKIFLQSMSFPTAEDLRKEADGFGFKNLKPLAEADNVSTGTADGVLCTRFDYYLSDGSVYRVYMDGEKLRALEAITAKGEQDMFMCIYTISDTLPTLPPKEYKSQLGASFVADMMGET